MSASAAESYSAACVATESEATAAAEASAPGPILPGSTIGIVGGGQLGRMLALCARRFGYKVVVLTGGAAQTPAGAPADIEIAAGFDDDAAIGRFVSAADVITWEFENVDTTLADAAAAAGVPVRPSASVIAVAQDRALEKRAINAAGLTTARWLEASMPAELRTAVDRLGAPVIVKAARFGYDGKSQQHITATDQVPAAWERLGSQRLVVESVVGFDCELSVVLARGPNGSMADHGVMHNDHRNRILDVTAVPGEVPASVSEAAVGVARRLAEALEVVGVLCVELFSTPAGLVVNEIAPRPHNSGHCTIEAAPASQFEQQLRAICGLPLGDGRCRPAAMAQLLGDLWADGPPPFEEILDSGVHLHLYGKPDPRPGRKMGHLTAVGASAGEARRRVLAAREKLCTPRTPSGHDDPRDRLHDERAVMTQAPPRRTPETVT